MFNSFSVGLGKTIRSSKATFSETATLVKLMVKVFEQSPFVAVRTTVKSPPVAYVCEGLADVEVFPSPKFQEYEDTLDSVSKNLEKWNKSVNENADTQNNNDRLDKAKVNKVKSLYKCRC